MREEKKTYGQVYIFFFKFFAILILSTIGIVAIINFTAGVSFQKQIQDASIDWAMFVFGFFALPAMFTLFYAILPITKHKFK